MGRYKIAMHGHTREFSDLRTLMACASPRRSGDELAGLAADNAEHRALAQLALAEVELERFLSEPLIDPDIDDVSALILEDHDDDAFARVGSMTVGELREWMLAATSEDLRSVSPGLTPEMVAAVAKIMALQDLVLVASRIHVTSAFRSTIGLPGRMSVRLQPNHPTDDLAGITAAIVDGLLYGCGDAVIGINPATDSVERCRQLLELLDDLIGRYEIPTQSCVLAHITTTMRALDRGAPVDLIFQSIAGTQAANESFGVDLSMLAEANTAARQLRRGTVGTNVMYFETGQGSCLSANAHHGVDQQTLEARAYAVARRFDPLLVNSVVGFIGPEYLHDGKQVIRAGLEDHFCGKVMGLPMGCDVCYTNHMDADQDDMDALLTLLGVAGCSYIMGVPGADDVMLGYQSTSFHDAQYVRQVLGKRPAPEFENWLRDRQLLDADNHLMSPAADHQLVTETLGELSTGT